LNYECKHSDCFSRFSKKRPFGHTWFMIWTAVWKSNDKVRNVLLLLTCKTTLIQLAIDRCYQYFV